MTGRRHGFPDSDITTVRPLVDQVDERRKVVLTLIKGPAGQNSPPRIASQDPP